MMMTTLSKENFWDEMEQKYPKAMVHFKEWVDKYKSEHNWDTLFSCEFEGDKAPEYLPKYHELPIAMQFGIWTQYLYDCTNDRQAFTIEINTGYTGRTKTTMEAWCRTHVPHIFMHLEARL